MPATQNVASARFRVEQQVMPGDGQPLVIDRLPLPPSRADLSRLEQVGPDARLDFRIPEPRREPWGLQFSFED